MGFRPMGWKDTLRVGVGSGNGRRMVTKSLCGERENYVLASELAEA